MGGKHSSNLLIGGSSDFVGGSLVLPRNITQLSEDIAEGHKAPPYESVGSPKIYYPVHKVHHLDKIKYKQPFFYFVTTCTKDFIEYFGEVKNLEMNLNKVGEMILAEWLDLTSRYPSLLLDKFQIMPNHVHGIFNSDDKVNIHEVMKSFKSLTTNAYIFGVRNYGWAMFKGHIWQESYFDHIIRNEADYERIWTYIDDNPRRWEEEHHAPGNFYDE